MIHTFKGFGIVDKAEVDVFLELCYFFDYPLDVGSLISGSSAFFEGLTVILKNSKWNQLGKYHGLLK